MSKSICKDLDTCIAEQLQAQISLLEKALYKEQTERVFQGAQLKTMTERVEGLAAIGKYILDSTPENMKDATNFTIEPYDNGFAVYAGGQILCIAGTDELAVYVSTILTLMAGVRSQVGQS